MTVSYAQICALRDTMREHDGADADLDDLPHRAVQYVIWKDDEQMPIAQGSISVGGTVRPDVVVAV